MPSVSVTTRGSPSSRLRSRMGSRMTLLPTTSQRLEPPLPAKELRLGRVHGLLEAQRRDDLALHVRSACHWRGARKGRWTAAGAVAPVACLGGRSGQKYAQQDGSCELARSHRMDTYAGWQSAANLRLPTKPPMDVKWAQGVRRNEPSDSSNQPCAMASRRLWATSASNHAASARLRPRT